ncbi:hypothetical protein SCZ71_15310 [Legionella pneumophila serogroup 1]|nr:hypothetical protein [Legionella pneumophila]HAT9524277.1 hypothetical protein [Legionella pneumophila subsp. pneumophila]HAU0865651.1 hypothetical protein [Legionella pneumophila]HDV5726027.1 hypothetical protein [Legionella pneumophila]HDV5727772.1 hypothetical protein [Legionella pneumophila]
MDSIKYYTDEIVNFFGYILSWLYNLISKYTPEFVNAAESKDSIFGFAEFISALALLVIVYTVTDIRYKFRVSVAPIPLFRITYYSIIIIGITALFSDVWFAKQYHLPAFLNDQILVQGLLAGVFLVLVVMWVHYAFINPSIFGKRNYKKYAQHIYHLILKGSEHDLSVMADELARSAKPIVQFSKTVPTPWERNEKTDKNKPSIEDYAYELLLLIGNKKFCRHIISSSPHTAILIFDEMTKLEKYNLPIGQFAQNITTEAISNSDSLLFHEEHGYESGLIGYIKPFSKAIYGNSKLINQLATEHRSPLDINYKFIRGWSAQQFEAYTRCVLIFLEDYLKKKLWVQHSYALHRALDNIERSCSDLYKLDKVEIEYQSDIYQRLKVAVDFVADFISLIDKLHEKPPCKLKRKEKDCIKNNDIYDKIADLQFKIIFEASSVTAPSDTSWFIQHNSIWSRFFGITARNETYKIIQFKLRRLLYDEIKYFEKFINYKSARTLGFCLNVMGLVIGTRKDNGRAYYPLRYIAINWTKKNYLSLRKENPDVADACLIGSISFDKENSRLVKTYFKGLNLEAPKEYLDLDS